MLGTPYTCLYIEEIFLRICAFVALDPDRPHTLAALLRVCKAFYEPTIDTLWYEQASMGNLARCLPQHLWRVDHEYGLVINKGIRPQDWARFEFHATRIVVLDNSELKKFGNSRSISLNQGIYSALAGYYSLMKSQNKRSNQLFKNLRILRLTEAELPLAHHVLGFPAVFATEALRIFNLAVPLVGSVEASALSDLLLALKAGSPNLDELALELSSMQDLPDTALVVVSELKSLRRLHLSGPCHIGKYQNLSTLSSLPRLQSLYLSHNDFGASSSEIAEFGSVVFDTLESLSIVINEIPSAEQSYFRCLKLSRLKRLRIRVDRPMWQHFHARLHDMILPLVRSKSVERLAFEGIEQAHIHDAAAMIDIARLFPFTQLTHLEIDSLHFKVPDGSAMLQGIAEAWPNLRKLTLNDISLSDVTTFPISALSYLSQRCLQLEELNIIIDARALPAQPHSVTTDPKRNHSLRLLGLYRSPLTDPRLVADYLRYLFPQLKSVRHQSLWRSHISTEYNEPWLRVNERLLEI